eukprot:TRINITY_DN11049_c0_g1_i3.p1 TRINITY_DN11049_c0_g1~~TRINITY_DN11049_c0_g1_i3.p1  ORF type:complete len:256 (+),score=50.75 TRINITY_DN11049_c0_g1_i3:637-1404(+)
MDATAIAVVDGAPLYHTIQASRSAAKLVGEHIQAVNPDLPGEMVHDVQAMFCKVALTPEPGALPEQDEATVQLRQHSVQLGRIQTSAAELMFDSSLTDSDSVPELVLKSLLLAPREARPGLASKLILSGGGAMIPGFEARLLAELERLVLEDPRFERLRGVAVGNSKQLFGCSAVIFEPNCVGWGGASILASVKGITWAQCGRVSRDNYTAARAQDGSIPRSLVPGWNHLHHANLMEEEATPVTQTHKPSRWQVA